MKQSKLHIALGILVTLIIGITLTFSTLHSHHNLELHNSSEFADTGHCFTDDNTVCPICANLIKPDLLSDVESDDSFLKPEAQIILADEKKQSVLFYLNSGRSPPVLG